MVLATGGPGNAGVTAPRDPVAIAPPTWDASQLAHWYADSRKQLVVAAAQSRRAGDSRRADRLAAMGRADRQFLRVNLAGEGEAVEVLGDLLTARRVVLVVPGS